MLARALAAVAPSVERLHLELMGQLVVGQWASRMVRLRHADLIAQKLVVSTALRGLSNLQVLSWPCTCTGLWGGRVVLLPLPLCTCGL